MLRFLGQFQADFQLKSGWIEPLLVGGYAPFSPQKQRINSYIFCNIPRLIAYSSLLFFADTIFSVLNKEWDNPSEKKLWTVETVEFLPLFAENR